MQQDLLFCPLKAAKTGSFAIASISLDHHDREILRILQDNGRIAIVDLARKINLSATPCTQRLKRLERAGIISGYHARLSPQALGQNLLVFVEVSLEATDEETLERFNRAVARVPQIFECHMLGGGFDYLLKVRVAGMQSYRDLHARTISVLPRIKNTHSYFVMEQVKESNFIAV